MLEAGLERKFALMCTLRGITQAKLSNLPGYPDRIVWLKGGRPVLIEFKSPTGVLSAKQKVVQKRLIDLGYKVYVINDKQTLTEVFNELVTASLSDNSTGLSD
jgi:hypothetical protein